MVLSKHDKQLDTPSAHISATFFVSLKKSNHGSDEFLSRRIQRKVIYLWLVLHCFALSMQQTRSWHGDEDQLKLFETNRIIWDLLVLRAFRLTISTFLISLVFATDVLYVILLQQGLPLSRSTDDQQAAYPTLLRYNPQSSNHSAESSNYSDLSTNLLPV
ncbi:hypothetical protein V8C42DRAFT_272566 [Trichoderma barbatum]